MYDHKVRYDNKVRLSSDVLEKAEIIAQEWGLKNARAAVEAVFRKYSDSYLEGHSPGYNNTMGAAITVAATNTRRHFPENLSRSVSCAALDELDDLLSL
jgi:hypothetical protein